MSANGSIVGANRRPTNGLQVIQQCVTKYGTDTLCTVEHVRYIGCVLSIDTTDLSAMRQNLKKACTIWGRISNYLVKVGVLTPVTGMFY